MTIQSTTDLTELTALGRIAASIRDTVAELASPAITTRQLDTLAARLAARHGARSAPQDEYGFPGFLCLSVNDAIVHGVPNDRPLAPGDVITVDVTIARAGYVVDTARTVALPGTSPTGERLAASAAEALTEGVRALSAGTLLSRVGAAISGAVRQAGFHVLRDLCGHGVGRRIHEFPPVPNYPEPLDDIVVWDGLVLAIEPIISADPTAIHQDADGWTLRTATGCHSAHYEHTVVVCEGRALVLTEAALH